MICPHCNHEFEPPNGHAKGVDLGTQKGEEIDSGSGDLSGEAEKNKSANVPLFDLNSGKRARGKALVYSGAFEVAWRSYGRKEEKLRAYKEWVVQAPSVGGENRLLQLILAALKWQGPRYAEKGWEFAKYFERYLRARKWEDEPLPEAAPQAAPARAGSTFAPLPGESFAERDTRLRRQAAALRKQEDMDADRVALEALKKAGLRP